MITVNKIILWWIVLLTMAILNGMLREGFLIQALGIFTAQIISGLILSSIIFFIAFLATMNIDHLSPKGCWFIGSVWLVMTVIFEFTFGIFIQHKDLFELLQAYTFKDGNIWPIVLISTLVSPRFFYFRKM